MFFYISKQHQSNFPHNYKTENFVISLDEGWDYTRDQYNNDIWYKGYLDTDNLSDKVIEISAEEDPKHFGNFCVIKVFDQGLVIRSDKLRSFPIWHNAQQGLTNLKNIGDIYWADSYVMLTNEMQMMHSKFDTIGDIDQSILSFDQVVEKVDSILDNKISKFLTNVNKPLHVFLSGGIDTALIYSYIQKHTDNYELISYSHIDFDYFYLKNQGFLKKFWGYNQIHHWKQPCILASGAPGDEFTVRSPTTANLLLLHYGTSIPELMQDPEYKNSLHYWYYDNEKYYENWDKQKLNYLPSSLKDVIKTCCEYNINDWQHCHLGNTLTWTPLRDLDIFKTIARLHIDDLKNQIMNSTVQMKLIAKNNPEILTYLTKQKNNPHSLENLTNLFCK